MDALQIFAVGVTLGHACLLAGVYFSSSIHTDAFVSTEIHSMVFFRVVLSCVVIIEAALCGGYIYNFYHAAPHRLTWLATALILAAVAAWCLVASYPTDRPEHLAGAVCFIVFTAAYALFFISKSARARPALYSLWSLSIADAGAFAAVYFAGLYREAAALEWAAFTLDAITLCLFFAVNPQDEAPQSKRAAQTAEYALPLLHPSAYT